MPFMHHYDAAGAVSMRMGVSSVGLPCVAQRVWPMIGALQWMLPDHSSRLRSFPGARRIPVYVPRTLLQIRPSRIRGTPAVAGLPG